MKPVELIDVCRTSHRVFVAGLATLPDDDFRAPSLLPGYTRAHVVAHVVNKANAHIRLVESPTSEVLRLHPEGYDPDAAAAAGTRRPASALRGEVASAFDRLEAGWEALGDDEWERRAIMMAGPRTMAEIVGHHLRNVEVHHVDLGIGYRPSDWPRRFVDDELKRRLRSLADRADHARLLAWLLDRAPAPELGPW